MRQALRERPSRVHAFGSFVRRESVLSMGAALGVAFAMADHAAVAEPVVGADLHGALAFKHDALPGGGGTLFGGYSLDLEPVLVEPEIAIGLEGYSGHGALPDLLAFRAMAGARAGITAVVEPSLFVHLGYGFIKPFASGVTTSISSALAIDSGFSLDYRPYRYLTVGGTIGYEGLVGHDSLHGIFLGPRIGYWIK